MSKIGYYRYKISDLPEGINTVNFYQNGAIVSSATIIIKPFCPGFRLLKFLDSSGRYRFFPFNNKWQQTTKVQSVGKISKFVTNIETDQSDTSNIGYNSTRNISLVAESVTLPELDVLIDLFNSPRVYLYVGSGSDKLKDWVEVSISGDGINRMRKANSKKVQIEVTLPNINSIKM